MIDLYATRRRDFSVAIAVLLAVFAVGPRDANAQAKVATLSVPGRASANPSIAAHGTFVAVAFSAATTNAMDIFTATSRDGGRTFTLPVQVNNVVGDARVSGEEPPKIALVPRGGSAPEIVVVWTAKTGTTWRLLSARSLDGGRTYSPAKTVPGSDAEGSRGWESVAVDANGRINVLWLDHRDLIAADAKIPPMTHAHGAASAAPKTDPTERAGLSQLMFSSLDSKSAIAITRSVCYCCKTSLVTSGNNVYAVWRHVYPGSMRDIAFTVSRDRGRTFAAPVRVSADRWKLDGCPDNGPAIALDRAQRAHIVWPTSQDGANAAALAIFYTSSSDGRTFARRIQIPTRGPASHPQVVIGNDGLPVVAWDEIVNGARHLGVARITRNAAGAVQVRNIPAADPSAGQWYPALAVSSAGTLAAWVRQAENGSAIGIAPIP